MKGSGGRGLGTAATAAEAVTGSKTDNQNSPNAAGAQPSGRGRIRDGDSIVRCFGGRRTSKGWLFSCPCHRPDRHPSAFMWTSGALRCFAGCSSASVAAALDAAGFTASNRLPAEPFHKDRKEDIAKAQRLWNVFAYPDNPENTAVVEAYLKSRAITVPMPTNVMRRFGPAGYIVALRQRNGEITAVFTRRLDQPHLRRSYGWMGRAAVELAAPLDGSELALAEGIETSLSVTQLTNIPCWAVLGCWRLHQISIPANIKLLHLFADNDQRGLEALERATKRYTRLGFNIRTHVPVGFNDYNDVLKGRV